MEPKDLMHPDVVKGWNDAEKASIYKESIRFKQDCRKKALEFAETDHDASKMTVSERLNRAGAYYKWLTEIPE